MLVILVVGLLLAGLVWFGLGIFGSAIEPASEDQIGGDPMEQSGEETPGATQAEPDPYATPAPQ